MNTSTQLLTKKAQGILSLIDEPKTIKTDSGKDIAFINALQALKQLQDYIDTASHTLRDAMMANNINKIEGDWGYIGFIPRTDYKLGDNIDPIFIKQTVDSKKVKDYMGLYDELPTGVIIKQTKYFKKAIK